MPRPRVVLDSSVLVAAFLRRGGVNAKVLQHGQREYALWIAQAILDEVRHALLSYPRIRQRYRYSDSEVEAFLDAIARASEGVLSDLPELAVMERDPQDNMVLACAVAARAQYLVTKDHDLLDLRRYKGIEILSAPMFLERLRDRSQGL